MGSQSKRLSASGATACLAWFLFGGLGFGACGGAAAGTNTPAESAHERSPRQTSDTATVDEALPDDEAPKKSAPCDDGTCTPCGSGICPSGWYCDESAAFGPACGWLPACAHQKSCGCLSDKLGPKCQCSEQAGGLSVTCK